MLVLLSDVYSARHLARAGRHVSLAADDGVAAVAVGARTAAAVRAAVHMITTRKCILEVQTRETRGGGRREERASASARASVVRIVEALSQGILLLSAPNFGAPEWDARIEPQPGRVCKVSTRQRHCPTPALLACGPAQSAPEPHGLHGPTLGLLHDGGGHTEQGRFLRYWGSSGAERRG